ncbi:Desumoylating isopeptidase 1 [Astathelohania contejeani]|uniref:Desumoylating isopeptidase 1 n=1 Tax=Astathelohania contejeani TaxID=164912 RepID=A0ABQ7HVS6_9MICR|nr:Desumoylating isopeptidase 1 [Thelohania contejeani]
MIFPVILRIYDLSHGQAKILSKTLLGVQVDGIWHTSVEVYGKEYYFQNGIIKSEPGKTHHGEPVITYDMGFTGIDEDSFNLYLESISYKYNTQSYNLFKNNCNHFSNDVTSFLVSKSIPDHILELPEIVIKSEFFNSFSKIFENKRNDI